MKSTQKYILLMLIIGLSTFFITSYVWSSSNPNKVNVWELSKKQKNERVLRSLGSSKKNMFDFMDNIFYRDGLGVNWFGIVGLTLSIGLVSSSTTSGVILKVLSNFLYSSVIINH